MGAEGRALAGTAAVLAAAIAALGLLVATRELPARAPVGAESARGQAARPVRPADPGGAGAKAAPVAGTREGPIEAPSARVTGLEQDPIHDPGGGTDPDAGPGPGAIADPAARGSGPEEDPGPDHGAPDARPPKAGDDPDEGPRKARCEALLAAAEAAALDGRIAEAERMLEELPADADAESRARAELLRMEFPIRLALEEGRVLYRAGEGRRALAALEGVDVPGAAELRERIARVVELSEAAAAAAGAGRENEAVLSWVGVLAAEPDGENTYRAAASVHPWVRTRCRVPAEIELAAANRELRAARWSEARERFDRALELFPHHEEVERAIREFCREAERDFNSDMALHHKGQLGLDLLLARLEGVLAFLRPEDGDLYASYRGVYERLRARKGN